MGTIVVDLEQRQMIALLADDREATVAAWLEQHLSIQIVCRDRSRVYANAIRGRKNLRVKTATEGQIFLLTTVYSIQKTRARSILLLRDTSDCVTLIALQYGEAW
jgi:hypothetical protein